jgi:hypothetical protein
MSNEIQVVEYEGRRVLTTAQIAQSYGTESKIINQNFNRNKERYTEGKHYYSLAGKDKENLLCELQIEVSKKDHSILYLWTEKGAWLHAKSLNTDKAWNAYELLVDDYYRIKEQVQTKLLPTTYKEALLALVEQVEITEKLEKDKKLLEAEVTYKEDVIIGLVDEISLAEKRQILNRVVRKGGVRKAQDRWRELYKQFENKQRINLDLRYSKHQKNKDLPKVTNKVEYIELLLGKLPELYEIACKLYENEVRKLVQEMYELNSKSEVNGEAV